jgi:hypothetical protein
MKTILLNPYFWLAQILVLLLVASGSWWIGHRGATNACAASNGKSIVKVEAVEDRRDTRIDAIGTATAAATADQLNQNRGSTDESAERIRTVVVPGDCSAVDPGIVRELSQARDDANAALGSGLRSGGARTTATDSRY